MLPFFMFRNLAQRLPSAIAGNRGLYAYRQVKPIDALLARAIVEIGLSSAVYLTALSLLGWLGYHWWPVAPLELIVVSAVLLLLGASLGLLFAVLVHSRPKVQSVVNMIFFPLYLLSGVLFPVHFVPEAYRDWLLLNPVLHLIDLARSHFIPNYAPLPEANLAYPAAFMLVTLALAISLYRVYRFRLLSAD
jgi:capsular polysaccharide transport system permease protein